MQLVIANTKLELAVLNFKTERRASALPSASVKPHSSEAKRKDKKLRRVEVGHLDDDHIHTFC